MHLLVELENTAALSRAMKGLNVRLSRGLNQLWQRRGSIFPERFHSSVFRAEERYVKATLSMIHYVTRNARRHGLRLRGVDPFSSEISLTDSYRSAFANTLPNRLLPFHLPSGTVSGSKSPPLLLATIVPPRTQLLRRLLA